MNFKKLIAKMTSGNFIMKIIESFIGRGSFLLFTLLFSYISVQLYGVEVFGEFTYAFTLVQVLMILATAGFNNGLMYSIPKHGYKDVSFSFVINFLLSLVIVGVGWVFIEDHYIRWMLPLIWLLSAEQLFFGIYRSERKIKEYYVINGLVTMILRIVLIIAFYYITGKNEYSIAYGVYASFLFSNAMYYFYNRRKINKYTFDKSYLKYSLTLILASLLGVMINKIDILMLGSMTTKSDVGIYQITVQVSNILSALLLIFNTVFAPEISRLFHSGQLEQMKRMYVKATRILALTSVTVTVILILSSNFILYFFGAEFLEGQNALILRSVAHCINLSVGGVWLMLSMTGQPKFQMYANIVAFLINILLNYLLIPKYGINGAAFASMVTIIFTNIVGYMIVSKRFNVKVFKFV
ncbi:polysaccharide biosynthesis C-terminal domain-containing protein [Thalassobacillus devorans]|uniref:oligosaccharide flippase family protein n=1 Tax=Thalassobacillus devorans TaxID=279813 RepID=UPI00048E30FC|nr:polysaccharide biosynthesis C-terminal domain-containing protein [Thalassobacillus devorans]